MSNADKCFDHLNIYDLIWESQKVIEFNFLKLIDTSSNLVLLLLLAWYLDSCYKKLNKSDLNKLCYQANRIPFQHEAYRSHKVIECRPFNFVHNYSFIFSF